jgi:ABC-type branched-subunit amino acid transport system substrate-binding protein
LALVGIASTVALTVTACGGSMVKPQDFIGLGGPNIGTTTVSGGTNTGTTGTTGTTTGTGTTGLGTNTGTTGTTSGGTTTGGTTGGTTTGGTTGGSTGTSSGGGVGSAAGGFHAASCAGFKNGPGITNSTITLATIADVSGAVANEFKSAFDAMNAYVAYFNSTSSICGRKLKLLTYDSGLTATGSNSASKAACGTAFALVGSFSAFDSGGADVTASCGQPDIRASAVEVARQQARTTIQVLPLDTNHIFLQPWAWAKQRFGNGVIKKAAFVYLDAGASGTITGAIRAGSTAKLGYDWIKTIIVPVAGVPDWNGWTAQLKAAGVQFVSTNLSSYTVNLKAAFDQAGYHPIFLADGSAYGPQYLQGSDAATMQGVYAFTQTAMLEEASRNPELQLMLTWLARTGGDAGNITAMQAWAAGRLFVQTALGLGGKLTRASLLAALRQVHQFNGNGILTPTDPGSGTTGRCATVVQVNGNHFIRITPYPYTCGPLA